MFSLHHCQVGNAGHGGRNLVCLGTGKPGSAPPRVGPQGQARRHFDHWVSADPTGAPAILQVDSRPQAILKFRPPNSLAYSTRYGCQPECKSYGATGVVARYTLGFLDDKYQKQTLTKNNFPLNCHIFRTVTMNFNSAYEPLHGLSKSCG